MLEQVGISRCSLVMEALALRLQRVGDPERGADPVPGARIQSFTDHWIMATQKECFNVCSSTSCHC